MSKYYGTKLVGAEPMTRKEYNDFRGWALPDDENGDDEGYLIEDQDGGKPNVESRKGYVSWSPKEQFENAYQPLTALSFGHAIEVLKSPGGRVARAGWNGKDMYVYLQNPGGGSGMTKPYLCIAPCAETRLPWVASQADILANDWMVIE